MRLTFVLLLAITAIAGCAKQEDLDALRQSVDQRMEAAERFASYYSDPVKFEILELELDDDEVTGVIRTNDDRLKGRTIYMDVEMKLITDGEVFETASDYLFVTDRVGKIESSFFFTSQEELRLSLAKTKSVDFTVRGWSELLPSIVEIK